VGIKGNEGGREVGKVRTAVVASFGFGRRRGKVEVSGDEEETWREMGFCDWHVRPVRSKSTLKISHLSESNGSNIFDDVA
jgi:hypothetical protein